MIYLLCVSCFSPKQLKAVSKFYDCVNTSWSIYELVGIQAHPSTDSLNYIMRLHLTFFDNVICFRG